MKILRKVLTAVLIQIVCGLALTSENAVKENKVTVNISKIESSEGQIILCIYDSSDTSFIGMPKEPVGLSNYDGKGIPGKFKKHKFSVTEDMTVSIPLKSF